MGVVIRGFFRCRHCGKLHQVSGVSETSVCACGERLWEQLRGKNGI
jgi:hypothetical protein